MAAARARGPAAGRVGAWSRRGRVGAWAHAADEEAAIGDTFFEAYARWRYAEALMAESAPAPLVEAAIATARPVAVRAEAGGLLRELDAIAG